MIQYMGEVSSYTIPSILLFLYETTKLVDMAPETTGWNLALP